MKRLLLFLSLFALASRAWAISTASVTKTFSDGEVIYASEINTNFLDAINWINNTLLQGGTYIRIVSGDSIVVQGETHTDTLVVTGHTTHSGSGRFTGSIRLTNADTIQGVELLSVADSAYVDTLVLGSRLTAPNGTYLDLGRARADTLATDSLGVFGPSTFSGAVTVLAGNTVAIRDSLHVDTLVIGGVGTVPAGARLTAAYVDPDTLAGATVITGATATVTTDDWWLGFGASAGRIVFDSTPATDELELTAVNVLMPNSSAFHVIASSAMTDTTGDGTTVTVRFNTEISDKNADFASNTFTAPATGVYELGTLIYFQQLDAAHTIINITITTSNRTYSVFYVADTPYTGSYVPGTFVVPTADMDAADTATVTVQVSGATKVVDLSGTNTSFWGRLVQ